MSDIRCLIFVAATPQEDALAAQVRREKDEDEKLEVSRSKKEKWSALGCAT